MDGTDAIFQAVLKGSKGSILDEVKKVIDAGKKPDEIINESLIPAINEVGEHFLIKRNISCRSLSEVQIQ